MTVSTTAALTIPLWGDLVAVGIGSLQGAMFASGFRDRRLDLLGVAIIGVATGVGGGLLRDLFLNVTPVASAAMSRLLEIATRWV